MMDRKLRSRGRMLAISPVSGYDGFNTSVHRIEALRSLGFELTVVDPLDFLPRGLLLSGLRRVSNRMYRVGLPVKIVGGAALRRECVRLVRQQSWQWLWLEKSVDLGAEALAEIRAANPEIKILGYSPDDMGARHNRSSQFVDALPHYDLFLTTKTYNVRELHELGARNVRFVANGFDPKAFRPLPVTKEEKLCLGGDIGFIGSFEADRARYLNDLAEADISVRVWGSGWDACPYRHQNLVLENRLLLFDDYALACNAFRINLNFLRKLNRDQQTTRSVEIPACGGFMMAERTEEHIELFREGVEAEFFSSAEELLEKCRFYLANEGARTRIARAGRQRCLRSGYSNAERLRRVLEDFQRNGINS